MDSQNKVKNIIFDLGCILVELHPQRCIDSFRSLGAEAVAKYIETHQTRDLFYHIEVGKITNAAFCEAVREVTELPLKDEEIESAWNSLIGTIPEHKLQAIKELAKTHQLFILSNTNAMHWACCEPLFTTEKGENVLQLFQDIFLSNELQLIKPSAEIFQEVVKRTGIKPEETLFIDDLQPNCDAACQLGFNVLHDPKGTIWPQKLLK